MRCCIVCMRRTRVAAQQSNTVTLYLAAIASHANRHARGTLKLTPTHSRPFDRAENRFPKHSTKHRSINQPHRNEPPGIKDVFAFQATSESPQNYMHNKKN